MLKTIFGSVNAERVLIYLFAREKGYAREISRFYQAAFTPIHAQLLRLERGGVLVSQTIGKTRVYEFNPRYSFLKELKSLLEKTLPLYPQEVRDNLLMMKRRTRRKVKDE
jgi:hypothetical protein